MTALLQDRARDYEKINKIDVTFTGSLIYKNALVGLVLAGASVGKFAEMGLFPSMRYYGRAFRQYDASLADKVGTVELDAEIYAEWLPQQGSIIVAADFGKNVMLIDDNTVALGSEAISGSAPFGTIWGVDGVRGVLVAPYRLQGGLSTTVLTLPAFVANDIAPAAIIDGGVYDIPITGAASTISLPATPRDGIRATLIADGVKNGHTVTVRDVATAITAALTASKRLSIGITSLGGKWFAAPFIGP